MDRLMVFSRNCVPNNTLKLAFCPARYAAKAATFMGSKRFRELPVETDAEKLVNYVCGANYFKDGSDPKIGPDSEYPEWIWKAKIDALPHPSDYDPKTREYWELAELFHVKRQQTLEATRPKRTIMLDEYVLKSQDRILRLRERAIIPEAIDHGYDPNEVKDDPIDPQIYLKPLESEKEVPLDKINPPPLFDRNTFYRDSVKQSYGWRKPEDLVARYRIAFPKYGPRPRRWNK